MGISRQFFLKGLGGVAAASGASTGLYFLIDNLLGPFSEIDIALMDYLDDGGDIKFHLTSGYGGNLKTKDLYFLNTNELSVAAEISLDDKLLIEKDGGNPWDKGKNDSLKKLNWGEKWKWRCEINFVRKSTYLEENKILGQYWLFGGFFRTLNSRSGDKEINKKIKKDFIRSCAIARNSRRMTGEVIKTPKEKINLTLNTSGNSMLYFNDSDMKKWMKDAQNEYVDNSTSVFDRALIDYLDDGGDIQFKITDGNKSSELNTFPTPSTTIKVSVGTADNPKVGTLTDGKKLMVGVGGKKENIKKPNGWVDWTWNCVIKFKKEESNDVNLKDEFGDKYTLFNTNERAKSFLNKLKDRGNEELKMNFIKNCAENRGKEKNNELNEKSQKRLRGEVEAISQIDSEKIFSLRPGKEGSKEYLNEEIDKYYFKHKWEMNKWFPKSLNF